eukprot:389022_1
MQVKMMQVLGRIRISGYIRNVSNFKRCFTKSFSTSPSQRVHQLIEAGTIKQDPKQDRVLELIDQLYVQIESYSPPSLPSKPCPNCASGTFNKSQQETKTRQCIIDALIQTIIAPFGRVRFRDFFMGD